MPLITDVQLARELRSGNLARVYYFYGKDIAALENYVRRLTNKLLDKDQRDMNLHRIDGRKLNFEALNDAVDTLPFFAEHTVVQLNDLDAETLGKQDFDLFCGILKELSDSTCLIIYATGVDLYKGKRRISDKNKKLCDLCAKLGAACEFNFKSPSELGKGIVSAVQKAGAGISKENAEYLAARCLCTTALILRETEKLIAFADGAEITREDIDNLCSPQLEADAFRLAGAILRRKGGEAFTILDTLFDQRAEGIAILAALSMSFTDLYRARVARSQGKTQQEMAEDFSYPKNRSFAVGNAFRDSANVPVAYFRRCMQILAKADTDMKSLRTPSRLLLEEAVAKMLVR